MHERTARKELTDATTEPVEPCRYHNELKKMQSIMSIKLGDYAFCLENIRPISNRVECEIARRFYQTTNTDVPISFGSEAFEKLTRVWLTRDEERAKRIMKDVNARKIGSIDLILQTDSVQKVSAQRISKNTRRSASPEEELAKASKIGVIANGPIMNNELRVFECGSNYFKTDLKIYCCASYRRYCTFAVVELPKSHQWSDCLPPNDGSENKATPMGVSLQRHQNERHEKYMKRINSNWIQWQIPDKKKTIEWNEIELDPYPFRDTILHRVSLSIDDAMILLNFM